MAQDTFSFRHHLVRAFRVLGHNLIVAFVTNFFLIPIEEEGIFRRMGIVAAGAFPLGQRGMHGGFFQDTLKVRMAFKAKLPPGAWVQMQGRVLALPGDRLLAMAGLARTLGKGRVQHRFEEFGIL